MQRFNIERFEYLCIQTDGDGGYDCYGCNSRDEVFQVLTDRIHDQIEWLEEPDSDWFECNSHIAEYMTFTNMIKSMPIIKNPEIIRKCYEQFSANDWGFYVIRDDGSLWFGWY